MRPAPAIVLALALTGCAAAEPERRGEPVAHRSADPAEVRIPAIGVRSRLERLALNGRGELAAPRDPDRAGWYAAGVRPGRPGPAVIAGHVDDRTGPAVFARLAGLRRRSVVLVVDGRGAAVRFRVEVVRRYPKARFPARAVYGGTPDAQLRLITCGGSFDRARGRYRDNVVVFASRHDG